MRFVAAGAVVAASLACGTAFAAEVRLEGVADADAQAIARGVEAHLKALEARVKALEDFDIFQAKL